MDDTRCRQYFVDANSTTYHRQYEVLRAVFVEERSQNEVADQFGYTHGSVRQLVHQFRQAMNEGNADDGASPFFESPNPAGRSRR